jgi:hypothetical protein
VDRLRTCQAILVRLALGPLRERQALSTWTEFSFTSQTPAFFADFSLNCLRIEGDPSYEMLKKTQSMCLGRANQGFSQGQGGVTRYPFHRDLKFKDFPTD